MEIRPFGEIVESSLTSWKAQCWQWDVMPAFGSLVVVTRGAVKLFGVVAHIQTGSLDQGRYPFPYQKTEEELRHEQPQIFALLQTLVSCITLGYIEEERIYYHLPAYPPKIHAFARKATNDEVRLFCATASYIPLLGQGQLVGVPLEELLLALFTRLAEQSLLTHEHLEQGIGMFAACSGNDYRKLKLFAQRLESLRV